MQREYVRCLGVHQLSQTSHLLYWSTQLISDVESAEIQLQLLFEDTKWRLHEALDHVEYDDVHYLFQEFARSLLSGPTGSPRSDIQHHLGFHNYVKRLGTRRSEVWILPVRLRVDMSRLETGSIPQNRMIASHSQLCPKS